MVNIGYKTMKSEKYTGCHVLNLLPWLSHTQRWEIHSYFTLLYLHVHSMVILCMCYGHRIQLWTCENKLIYHCMSHGSHLFHVLYTSWTYICYADSNHLRISLHKVWISALCNNPRIVHKILGFSCHVWGVICVKSAITLLCTNNWPTYIPPTCIPEEVGQDHVRVLQSTESKMSYTGKLGRDIPPLCMPPLWVLVLCMLALCIQHYACHHYAC